MAIVQNPITGRSSGSFAGAIFQTQYSKNIIRSKPVQVRDAKSASQLSQRQKFTVVRAWISMFLTVIRTGFAGLSTARSAYASALSWYLQNGVTLSGSTWVIDYANAKFTFGDLLGVSDASITSASTTYFMVSFSNNSNSGNALATDSVLAIIYNETKNTSFLINGSQTRADETIDESLSVGEVGDTLHFWIYFKSADGNLISDSIYVGSETLAS